MWRSLERLIVLLQLTLLTVYQRTLSLDHSAWGRKLTFRVCRYHPSCSSYMRDAIEHHGPWIGPWLGLKRLLRCNPLFEGGFDPVGPEEPPSPPAGPPESETGAEVPP